VLKPQKDPAMARAYNDCFHLLTKHYYETGDAVNREHLVSTYKDLLTVFLSGRLPTSSGLNIRFLQTVFEQCPALAWSLQKPVLRCFLAKESKTDKTSKGSRSNHQRIQAIELYQLLIRVAQKDAAAKTILAKNFALLAGVIGKVINSAETWENKKVKKTGLCVGLYAKAAKVLLSNEVAVDFEEDVKKLISEAGVKLVSELEAAIEKDKTMSNMKGKIKEIKKIIEL